MNKKIYFGILAGFLIAASLAFVAYMMVIQVPSTNNIMILSTKDASKTIRMKVGTRFTINLGSGYEPGIKFTPSTPIKQLTSNTNGIENVYEATKVGTVKLAVSITPICNAGAMCPANSGYFATNLDIYSATDANKIIILHSSDANKTINMKVGTNFAVNFDRTFSGGGQWYVKFTPATLVTTRVANPQNKSQNVYEATGVGTVKLSAIESCVMSVCPTHASQITTNLDIYSATDTTTVPAKVRH